MFDHGGSCPAARRAAAPRRGRIQGPGAVSAPTAPGPTTRGHCTDVLDASRLASHPDLTALERELAGLVVGLSRADRRESVSPPESQAVLGASSSPDLVSPDLVSPAPVSPALVSPEPAPQQVGPAATESSPAAVPVSTEPAGPLVALFDAVPSSAVAEGLLAHDVADLGGHDLVETIAAWERISAWAQAQSSRALAELLDRTRGSAQHEFVVDEVAARLALSRHAAEQHVAVAHGASRLPEVADAMALGLVDRRKAEVLVSTGRLGDDDRRVVVRELRPELEHLTVRQLRDRLRRAEIAVDPEGSAERHAAARRGRSVVLEPVDDAMAYLTAYLPADDAVRAFAALDGVAVAQHRSPGETRRLDECRADAFVALVTGRPASGPVVTGHESGQAGAGVPTAAPESAVRRAMSMPVRVTIAASTMLGADDLPALLAGYGPIPAPMARALAADTDATWQRILADPTSGVLTDMSSRSYRPSRALRQAVIARDETCRFPGCGVPARRGDLDHIAPFDPARDGPQTHGDNLHALCRTHHRARTTGGWSVARDARTGVTSWRSPTGHEYTEPPHRPLPARPDRARPDRARPDPAHGAERPHGDSHPSAHPLGG